MKLDNKKSYALALSGGGARGAYQIGVMRALRENNIRIDAVTGTSIGAINGALIVQGDLSLATQIWENLTHDVVYNMNASGLDKIRDISKLESFLEKYISEEKIRKSDIQYGLVTFNVTTLEPVVKFIDEIPEGKLLDYILASANSPIFYRHEIDGEKYVDGAVFDNLPIAPLVKKGYKEIIAVDIYPTLSYLFREKYMNTANIFMVRSRHSLHEQFLFNPVKVKENLLKGYCDLKLYNGQYSSTHYYINGYSDKEELNAINQKDVKELINDENLGDIFLNEKNLRNYLRVLNEYVSEGKEEIGKLHIKDKDFFMACLEITAEIFEVESIIEYKYDDFIAKIYKKIAEITTSSKIIEGILNKNDINEFLKESANVNLFDKKVLLANLFIAKNKVNLVEEVMYNNFPKVSIAYITSFILKRKMEKFM